jgi:hypothetical protein
MRTAIVAGAACLALNTPASSLDYSCSPLTGACTPRSSSERYDPPPVYVAPRSIWPRTCDLDGPQAWDYGKPRERERHIIQK